MKSKEKGTSDYVLGKLLIHQHRMPACVLRFHCVCCNCPRAVSQIYFHLITLFHLTFSQLLHHTAVQNLKRRVSPLSIEARRSGV